MVEINNQRKAFLDIVGVVGGNYAWRQKPEIMVGDVIVGGELFTDYSDHPRKLVTLNPKLKSTGRTLPASFPLVGCHRIALGLKDFSPKSQDAVALQQIKERGALPMIDRGDIRQAPTVAANIPLHCRALVMYVSSVTAFTAWLQNSKKRAENVRERLMYEQSHRDYLRSGYLHHRSPVMGC